uniref:Putative odorant binding protein 1 n=1 Tax=Conopomorpha sinensis TaxID=940481 RepID=A0A5Q2UQS1_9NEOP|nr:putative odorant binding protein 1 [Conopomorpha sinensis]
MQDMASAGKCSACFLLIMVLLLPGVHLMTKQQLKNSGKLVKKTCMGKHDVTEEMVGDIQQGHFVNDRNVMCYIACVYSTSQVVKNNKLSHEAMIKQVDMMFPPEYKDAVKVSIEKCKPVAKTYKDICEASYFTAKCMYEADTEHFLFP